MLNVTTHGVLKSPEGADRIYSNTNHFIALFFYPFYPIVKHRAWILDVMLIALVSNVTLLVWLSNFTQCWLPCARLNPVARIPWAPSTVQILKVTLIEWLLKLTLLALHQVFTPILTKSSFPSNFAKYDWKICHSLIKLLLGGHSHRVISQFSNQESEFIVHIMQCGEFI